jgi:hypothetical protein
MAKVRIPHYSVRKGRGYWLATPAMKRHGFNNVRCGEDGSQAWAIAEEWERRWQAVRRGQEAPLRKVYPKGSVGDGYERFRRTGAWTEGRKERTREDWDRGWKFIEPFFGDVDPATVTLEMLDRWYYDIKEKKGVNEAFIAMKSWRRLYNVLADMKLCQKGEDPSLSIRRETPTPRHQTFNYEEARKIVKQAWRSGYHGLACIAAIAWDTGYSPVDARTLTLQDKFNTAKAWEFRVDRDKTGVCQIGTLSYKTRRIVERYMQRQKFELLPDAPIFRNRSGAAYSKDTLGDDFRVVRASALGEGENRKLMDMRRSAGVEALIGGASAEGIGAKLGNSIGVSKALQRTYLPTQPEVVSQVDEARTVGRNRVAKEQTADKKLKLGTKKS